MTTYIHAHDFEEDGWCGKPLDDLLAEVRKHYPFADYHFDGGGRIGFFTGLWVDGQPILVATRLYESDPGSLLLNLEDKTNG